MNKDKKTVKKKEIKKQHTPMRERITSYFCPILLGSSLCFSTVYILHKPSALSYTILAAFFQFVLFMLFDKLKSAKAVGAVIYTLLLFIVMSYSMRLVFSAAWAGYPPPSDWFYGEEGIDSNQPMYLNALFTGGGFFVASILYYFTQVRYRSLGVMLCTLFPFVLYAKRGDSMPEILITLILTCFLSVMVHNRRIDPARPKERLGKLKIDRAYIISFAIFISVTGALAMMIKKPSYRSKLEKSADFFDTLLFAGNGSGYETFSRKSSTRRGGFGYNSTPLFYLDDYSENKDIYYLRRQVYDDFNGNIWEASNANLRSISPYILTSPVYSTDGILNDMLMLTLYDDIPAPDIKNSYKISQLWLHDENFNAAYLPAPYGTLVSPDSSGVIKYYQDPTSAMIAKLKKSGEPTKPLDDRISYLNTTHEVVLYAKKLNYNAEEYKDFLNRNIETPEAQRLLTDYTLAERYFSNKSGISEELASLTDEITAGCHGDYDKAAAITRYFSENGYKYSTEYIPKDNSIDYFVFESKTGYCAAYATAMTLMARHAGMPARYVEGFAAFERTDTGEIIVREGHAHAFVEVYIPGTGWMTFDPTVSDYMSITGKEPRNYNFIFYLLFLVSRFFIVFLVGFFIIFVLLLDRLQELIFRIILKFAPPRKKTLMLYSNLIKVVSFSAKEDYSVYTVKMLREYLKTTRGIVPEELLALFEKTAFGGYEPTKEEFDTAYSEYKKCYKYMRKIPKKLVSA